MKLNLWSRPIRWKVLAVVASVISLAGLPAMMFCMTMLTGCSQQDIEKNEAVIGTAVKSAAHVGTWKGLEAFGKKNPSAAKQVADSLRLEMEARIIPYLLEDQQPLLSDFLRDELSKLRQSKIDPLVTEAIILAATVLDAYLPAPRTSTALSPVQRRILARFCEGISKGAGTYLAGKSPDDKTIEESNLAHRSVANRKAAKRSWLDPARQDPARK